MIILILVLVVSVSSAPTDLLKEARQERIKFPQEKLDDFIEQAKAGGSLTSFYNVLLTQIKKTQRQNSLISLEITSILNDLSLIKKTLIDKNDYKKNYMKRTTLEEREDALMGRPVIDKFDISRQMQSVSTALEHFRQIAGQNVYYIEAAKEWIMKREDYLRDNTKEEKAVKKELKTVRKKLSDAEFALNDFGGNFNEQIKTIQELYEAKNEDEMIKKINSVKNKESNHINLTDSAANILKRIINPKPSSGLFSCLGCSDSVDVKGSIQMMPLEKTSTQDINN